MIAPPNYIRRVKDLKISPEISLPTTPTFNISVFPNHPKILLEVVINCFEILPQEVHIELEVLYCLHQSLHRVEFMGHQVVRVQVIMPPQGLVEFVNGVLLRR